MTKQLLLFFVTMLGAFPLLAQSLTVTGVVSDTNGAPLPGVNVVEKGTTNGTSTDFDGNYSIDVANDATLIIHH